MWAAALCDSDDSSSHVCVCVCMKHMQVDGIDSFSDVFFLMSEYADVHPLLCFESKSQTPKKGTL